MTALLMIGIGSRRRMTIGDLLDQGADALGLLNRVFDDLLQVNAIAGRLRKLVALLLDLVHVEQQRGQRTVQLPGDRSSRLFRRPNPRGGQMNKVEIVFEGRDVFHPF